MQDISPALNSAVINGIGRAWLRDATRDRDVLEQNFHTEEFNISTARQFAWARAAYDQMRVEGSTPLVIDCGANIGLTALCYAHHLPQARIVGVEPDHDNVELARRSFQCVKTMRANIKTAVVCACKSVSKKHMVRTLAEFEWRVNHRQTLASRIPVLACAGARTNPKPYR